MIMAIAVNTRVCQRCGMEKPIEDFGKIQRWRLRVCKVCRYAEQYLERRVTVLPQRRKYYQEHRDVFLARMKKYHNKHWDEYYEKHQETLKLRTRQFYAERKPLNMALYGTSIPPLQLQKNKERDASKRAENKQLYGYVYPPEKRQERLQHYLMIRLKALNLYGGKCECCGESRYEMLTFDHKVKTYYKDKIRGVALVYEVIKEYKENGYPNGKYGVLCWNCNTAKGFYHYCPHETQTEWNINKGRQLKLEMILAYGGRCVLCGENKPEFLTIDHINGNGTKHRQSVGVKGGAGIYRWLKNQHWPKNDYRVLCANCNCSMKRNKWTKEG